MINSKNLYLHLHNVYGHQTWQGGNLELIVGRPHIPSKVTFRLRGYVTNSKNLYLLFRNNYDHQTWQSSNLRLGDPTFKVM